MTIILLWLGGIIGAWSRYHVGRLVGQRAQILPIGTFVINLSGSFALGLVIRFLAQAPPASRESIGLLLGTGFCGAYTTFSTFAWDTVELWRAGQRQRAIMNVLLQIVGGTVAAWLGLRLG